METETASFELNAVASYASLRSVSVVAGDLRITFRTAKATSDAEALEGAKSALEAVRALPAYGVETAGAREISASPMEISLVFASAADAKKALALATEKGLVSRVSRGKWMDSSLPVKRSGDVVYVSR